MYIGLLYMSRHGFATVSSAEKGEERHDDLAEINPYEIIFNMHSHIHE